MGSCAPRYESGTASEEADRGHPPKQSPHSGGLHGLALGHALELDGWGHAGTTFLRVTVAGWQRGKQMAAQVCAAYAEGKGSSNTPAPGTLIV